MDEALAAAGGTDEDEILPEPQFLIGQTNMDPAGDGGGGDDADNMSSDSSGGGSNLFSSQSWEDKVTRGELSALVREKSRSVQDLMVLTHIEPISDIEFLGSGQGAKENGGVAPPHISITEPSSPSSSVHSPLMESDVPLLLDSTDGE